MLNRRRFIARNNALDSQPKMAALDLHSNCTISLLHWTTRLTTKRQNEGSRSSKEISINLDGRIVCRRSLVNLKPASDDSDSDGGSQAGPSVRREGDDGGANEQLEACGYEIVPDVLGTDGGTWELLTKVRNRNIFSIHDVASTVVLQLLDILTVYRRRDPKKTDLIAPRHDVCTPLLRVRCWVGYHEASGCWHVT